MKHLVAGGLAALALTACASTAPEPGPVPPPAYNHPLDFMFGEWVGTAQGYGPGGVPFELTQTERVGPMLDGRIVVVEGTGYDEVGEVEFNAFAVISQSGPDGSWEIRSYNGERAGTFPLILTEDGFRWSIPAGPNATVEYEATVEDGSWTEIGHYVAAGMAPREVFRMTVERVSYTTWPAAGAVPPY